MYENEDKGIVVCFQHQPMVMAKAQALYKLVTRSWCNLYKDGGVGGHGADNVNKQTITLVVG